MLVVSSLICCNLAGNAGSVRWMSSMVHGYCLVQAAVILKDSPHVTESTGVLDSGFLPSGFRIPTLWIPDCNHLDSGFQPSGSLDSKFHYLWFYSRVLHFQLLFNSFFFPFFKRVYFRPRKLLSVKASVCKDFVEACLYRARPRTRTRPL